jgi:hypothetical protein
LNDPIESPDGAHLGLLAEEGFAMVLGEGCPIFRYTCGDFLGMFKFVRKASTGELFDKSIRWCWLGEKWPRPVLPREFDGYSAGALFAASTFLSLLIDQPAAAILPFGEFMDYARAKEAPLMDQLTIFQAGWAINAARRLCELPPVANPAVGPFGLVIG